MTCSYPCRPPNSENFKDIENGLKSDPAIVTKKFVKVPQRWLSSLFLSLSFEELLWLAPQKVSCVSLKFPGALGSVGQLRVTQDLIKCACTRISPESLVTMRLLALGTCSLLDRDQRRERERDL